MLASVSTQFSGGGYHTCVVTSKGGAQCWGYNKWGQLGNNSTIDSGLPIDPVGLTHDVVTVAAAGYHSCALGTTGGVQCWGYNGHGELGNGTTTDSHLPVNVGGLPLAIAISAGVYHTCALTTAGAVYCWGRNDTGQLGNNSLVDSAVPVAVSGLGSGVVAIAAGWTQTCALTNAGGVKCWGGNDKGQLGNNSTTASPVPVAVNGLSSGVATIAAGVNHVCALTVSGGAKCWGFNGYGALGNGTLSDSRVPLDVPGLTSGVAQLTTGWSHTCAVTTGGAAKCWGYNAYGEVGNDTNTNALVPADVIGLNSGVVTVAAGQYHTCAQDRVGGLKCWGINVFGQLGDNSTTDSRVPIAVRRFVSGVTAIAPGGNHMCALTAAGEAKCWGWNDYGQIGTGSLFADIATIAAGDAHTCAVTRAGQAQCWGWNFYGQLGNNSTHDSFFPVMVTGLASGVASITASANHTCALTTMGAVKCWGANSNGQLGNNSTTSSPVPVAVSGLDSGVAAITLGVRHTCALTTAGGVKCWGLNLYGELGNNTATDSAVPVDVSGLANGVIAISAGNDHTCALTMAGGVKCWGQNYYGELGNNAPGGSHTQDSRVPVDVSGLASGVSAIAARSSHTCALIAAMGGVKCWGSNYHGVMGNNGGQALYSVPTWSGVTDGAVAIGAGWVNVCALTTTGAIRCWGSNERGQINSSNSLDDVRFPAALLSGHSLTFNPASAATPLPTMLAGAPTTLAAVGTAVGVPTYDGWTSGTCSVSGSTLVGSSVGLCGVRASHAAGADGSNGTTVDAPQQLRLVRVLPASPTLSLSSSGNPSAFGTPVTFVATLASNGTTTGTGNITFCIDAAMTNANCGGVSPLCTVAANATSVGCPASALAMGTHQITAFFSGDANNGAAITSSALTQVVGTAPQITSTDTWHFIVTQGGGLGVHTSGTPTPSLTLSGNDVLPAGVTFHDNQNGSASLAGTPDLGTVRTYALHITADNGIAPAAMQTLTLTVYTANQVPLAVNASPQTLTYGGTTTLSTTGGSGTGAVNYAVVSGPCSIDATTLSTSGAGICSVNASKDGDANYQGSTASTIDLVINPAPLTLAADDKSRVYGAADPTFTWTSSGFVNGDTTSVLSGTPTLSSNATPTSSTGTYAITISAGTLSAPNYAFVVSSGVLAITQASSATTIASPCMTTFVEHQPLTLTATVAGANATGTVTFVDGQGETLCGNVALSGGTATCASSALTSNGAAMPATYELSASYGGDGNYLPSSTNALSVVVLSASDVVFRNNFETETQSCPIQ